MPAELTRFWFSVPGHPGIGVTAASLAEATELAMAVALIRGWALDPRAVEQNVDVRDLDRETTAAMGDPGPPGIWFPLSRSTAEEAPPMQVRSLMILIAGPYRSGTGDDPARMAANVRAMEEFALPLFRAGHLPVVGEWLALPMVERAGSTRVGDAAFEEIFHPIAERLVARCDAILRVGGPSAGADEMVRLCRERGATVYHRLEDVPGCS